MAYNFLKQDMSEKVLETCREKNIGTVLMKTNPTRQYYSLKQYIEMLEKAGKKDKIEDKYLNGYLLYLFRIYPGSAFALDSHSGCSHFLIMASKVFLTRVWTPEFPPASSQVKTTIRSYSGTIYRVCPP